MGGSLGIARALGRGQTMGYLKARESPKMKPSSTWDHGGAPAVTASFEEYRGAVEREVEKNARRGDIEGRKRHRQIDEMEVPPRTEERGPPSMPIPFNALDGKSTYKPGHFIFTDTADRYQKLKIKSLCVLARLALYS
ncbi:MAG: hypothetical protein M1840_003110 [Geoglossum simile]|nr:MAG: hypothetical protein M1840_003110 [Geoglossum simile]